MAGIYIHIPFCRQKCNYCNFFSLATTKYRDLFFQALLNEIGLTRDYLGDESIETIYFGGGTPSLFPVSRLEEIIGKIRDTGYAISTPPPAPPLKGEYPTPCPSPEGEGSIRYQVPEITMELNPEDVTPEYLKGIAAAGINRLSLGVQSFFDEDLNYLSRSHDAEQANKAIELIQDTRYGICDTYPTPGPSPEGEGSILDRGSRIASLSIDLIYGIPTLTDDHWKTNLHRVIDAGIPHLSAYALTVEPKTALAWQIEIGAGRKTQDEGRMAHGTETSNPVTARRETTKQRHPVSDDQSAEQFEILMDVMEQAGYIQYEISNFCLPGHESRHNSNYWKGVPYLGLGPSAHSYNGASRRWNISNLTAYIHGIESGTPLFEEEILTPGQRYNEYIMTSLRTIHGADPAEIGKRFGPEFETYFRHQATRHHCHSEQSEAAASGYLTESSGCYRLTNKGKLIADRMISDLFYLDQDPG